MKRMTEQDRVLLAGLALTCVAYVEQEDIMEDIDRAEVAVSVPMIAQLTGLPLNVVHGALENAKDLGMARWREGEE